MIVRKQGMTKSLALCVLLALVGCGVDKQGKDARDEYVAH